jgi:hypothetical protein
LQWTVTETKPSMASLWLLCVVCLPTLNDFARSLCVFSGGALIH